MVGSDDSSDYANGHEANGNKDVAWNPLGIVRTALTNVPNLIILPFLCCQELREDARRKTEKDAGTGGCQICIPKKQRASLDTTDLCTGTSFTPKNAFGLFVDLLCGPRILLRQDGRHQSPLLMHSLPERVQATSLKFTAQVFSVPEMCSYQSPKVAGVLCHHFLRTSDGLFWL